jgi:hypothetical protein
MTWQQSSKRDDMTAELWAWWPESRAVSVRPESRAVKVMTWQRSCERDDMTAELWAWWSESRAVARKHITVFMKRQLTWRHFVHFMQKICGFWKWVTEFQMYRHWSQYFWMILFSYLLVPRGKLMPSTCCWTLPLANVKVNNGCSHTSTPSTV